MTYYRHAAVDKIERAVAAAIASRSLEHALFKGRLREILITELIRPFLLPQFGVVTGLIVDQDGRQSNQIDVIIYDERVVPPLMLSASEGIVPCHSVLATIEVKSRLNMTELKKAVQNARSVKLLKYDYKNVPLPGERGFELVFQQKLLDSLQLDGNLKEQLRHALFDISSPACFLFAYTSDLAPSRSIHDEQARLQQTVDSANVGDPQIFVPISGLCVGDKGFSYCSAIDATGRSAHFDYEIPDVAKQPRPRGRKYWASHNVILKFESELANTCAVHSGQRWRIPLDVYFGQLETTQCHA